MSKYFAVMYFWETSSFESAMCFVKLLQAIILESSLPVEGKLIVVMRNFICIYNQLSHSLLL